MLRGEERDTSQMLGTPGLYNRHSSPQWTACGSIPLPDAETRQFSETQWEWSELASR